MRMHMHVCYHYHSSNHHHHNQLRALLSSKKDNYANGKRNVLSEID